MVLIALIVGVVWTVACLLAVGLCVASRRIDDDLAAGRTPMPRISAPATVGRFPRVTV